MCALPYAAKASPADLRTGTFEFLNEARDLGWPPDWKAVESDLWGFHLHYFGYIHDLGHAEKETLCIDWIEKNPIGTEPAWHPFPISLRLVNWCKAGLAHPDILSSMYRQAAFLYDHLETHLLGNHLLENARALITAGVYLRGQGDADAWIRRGLQIYEKETPEQILADGGHFERSPMYHALMLEGYLDIVCLLDALPYSVGTVKDAAERMRAWLGVMIDPKQRIVLFNDAAHNGTPPIPRLLAYADRVLGDNNSSPHENSNTPSGTPATVDGLEVHHLQESGYISALGRGLFFVYDAGPIGPDYLPAHAHADIFSYILHGEDGRAWVVDSGTSTYEQGPVRQYERSTLAHNTVTVDDIDQAECWGAFRVARRFKPVSKVRRLSQATVEITGKFDGYATLIGDDIVHNRRVTLRHESREIRIVDRVTGTGRHRVSSRIHLHPDVRVFPVEEGVRLVQKDGTGTSSVLISTVDSPVRVDNGTYASDFGHRRKTKVLVLEHEQILPITVSYTIVY